MKTLLSTSLLAFTLALSAPTPAQAATAAALVNSSLRLITAAEQDVQFLFNNVENCTRFAETIKGRMLAPMRGDLKTFREKLQSAYGKLAANACAKPESSELDKGMAAVNQILVSINDKLALATQPQSNLMGMTGDEAMEKALTTDDNTPRCVAEDRRDPRSTRELKTYFALKLKYLALKTSISALKAETAQLKEGRGTQLNAASCRNAPWAVFADLE